MASAKVCGLVFNAMRSAISIEHCCAFSETDLLLTKTYPISFLFANNLSKYSVPLCSSSGCFVCKCLFSLLGNMASFDNFSQHMRHNG